MIRLARVTTVACPARGAGAAVATRSHGYVGGTFSTATFGTFESESDQGVRASG